MRPAVDVSSRDSVKALAATAASLGDVHGVIHAVGVSPSQAAPETILKVDLYGTAPERRTRSAPSTRR